MRLAAWAKTDRGIKRAHNEDSMLLAPELGLYAVADGMGGHVGGAHASRLALEVVRTEVSRSTLQTADGPDGPAVNHVLRGAAREANSAVYERSLADRSLRGMGTTLTAIRFDRERLHLVHAGDSRAYLFRDGKI